jgi:hypothetical protein
VTFIARNTAARMKTSNGRSDAPTGSAEALRPPPSATWITIISTFEKLLAVYRKKGVTNDALGECLRLIKKMGRITFTSLLKHYRRPGRTTRSPVSMLC